MVGDSNEMDPRQLKIRFNVEMPSPQIDGEMLVNIDLKEIKVFLRMNVFSEMSKFTITGLDRLHRGPPIDMGTGTDPDAKQPELASGRMRVKISMLDSIVCSERRERTKKVLVLKMNTKMEMTSLSEDFLKAEFEKQMRVLWSSKKKFSDLSIIDIKVEELTPYFIENDELNDKRFRSTKKRELITPLSCAVSVKSDMSPFMNNANKPTGEYDRRSTTSVKLSSIIVKVSMDDLYVLNSIASHLSAQALEISQLWSDYT